MNAQEGVELFKEHKARFGDVCTARKRTEENAHLPTYHRSLLPNLYTMYNWKEVSHTRNLIVSGSLLALLSAFLVVGP